MTLQGIQVFLDVIRRSGIDLKSLKVPSTTTILYHMSASGSIFDSPLGDLLSRRSHVWT